MLIVSYIIASVLLISFFEWWIHRYLMHKDFSRIPYLSLLFRNHTYQHHNRFYQTFNNEIDEVGRQFALRTEILPNFILMSPIYLVVYLVNPWFALVLACTQLFHHITWNVIHNEMHNPSCRFIRWIPGYKFLEFHHWMHHRYKGKNFNIVFPIFDYIMGTHIKPSEKDIKAYKEM